MSRTVLVTGYAAAPKGTAMFERYKHTGVALEIELESDRIVAAEATFVTALAQDFFARLLVGYDVKEGIDPLVARLLKYVHTPSCDSLVVACRGALQRYQEVRRAVQQGVQL